MSLDSVAVSAELTRAGAVRLLIHRAGIAALLLAVSAVVLEVLAIAIGSGGGGSGGGNASGTDWVAATVIAWIVICFQAVSIVLGLVAMVKGHGPGRRFDRRFGFVAVVLSLLSNPLLLVGLFSLLRGVS